MRKRRFTSLLEEEEEEEEEEFEFEFLILPVRRMDGAPSGQAEQFPLTSVGKSFLSASGIEPRTFAF
jgi:hypothetical protein